MAILRLEDMAKRPSDDGLQAESVSREGRPPLSNRNKKPRLRTTEDYGKTKAGHALLRDANRNTLRGYDVLRGD